MSKLPLEQAINILGNQTKLGEAIGCDQTTISSWLIKYDGKVPAEKAPAIEIATAGQITKYQLRPDLFEAPQEAPTS